MAGTFYNLIVHLIFSTKDREPTIYPELAADLYAYLIGICNDEGGSVIAIGGMPDHVHMLISLKPSISISVLMRQVKSNSSRWINDERRLPGHFSWQGGYGAFSVSQSQVSDVVDYIRDQNAHHARKSFKDEFRGFLIRNGCEFDEAHIWK